MKANRIAFFLNWRQAVQLLVYCTFAAAVLNGQQMQFRMSVYGALSPSADFSILNGNTSVIDNSIGCQHSGYSSILNLYSPDGRYAAMGGYMSAWASIPTNNVPRSL